MTILNDIYGTGFAPDMLSPECRRLAQAQAEAEVAEEMRSAGQVFVAPAGQEEPGRSALWVNSPDGDPTKVATAPDTISLEEAARIGGSVVFSEAGVFVPDVVLGQGILAAVQVLPVSQAS